MSFDGFFFELIGNSVHRQVLFKNIELDLSGILPNGSVQVNVPFSMFIKYLDGIRICININPLPFSQVKPVGVGIMNGMESSNIHIKATYPCSKNFFQYQV